MDDRDRFVFLQYFFELGAIADVADLKWTPFDELSVTVCQVVEHDWCKALVEQIKASVGPDISSSTSDKYICHVERFPRICRILSVWSRAAVRLNKFHTSIRGEQFELRVCGRLL